MNLGLNSAIWAASKPIFAVAPRSGDKSAMSAINRGFFISALASAVLVKIPPPTRINIASNAAPKPKPSKTLGASPE